MHEEKLWDILYDFQEVIDGGRKISDREPYPSGSSCSREQLLTEIEQRISACERCPLSQGRTNTVPGYGIIDPMVMVIGEAPGAEEDRQGLPFVGTAGQYLDKWLSAIGLDRRKHAFIGNVVKCRPPGNRDPLPEELERCLPYLREQTAIIRPRVILTVGRISTQTLLGKSDGIGKLRGRVYQFEGIPLVPTYHPSGVLRNPEFRRPVWDDLKQVKALLESEGS